MSAKARRHCAPRSEQRTTRSNPTHPDWSQLLVDAVTKPGVIASAYTAFWNYSFRNQLLAYFECLQRHIEPGPIHTFVGWLKLNRHVRKGEKGITLCMPRTVKRKRSETPPSNSIREPVIHTGDQPVSEESTFTTFIFKPFWFVLSQTEGQDLPPAPIPEWSEAQACHTLMIDRVTFSHSNGNVQGYASGKAFAVSPIAYLPHRTMFHEIAHIVLGHTEESLGMSDADEFTPRDVREVEAESVAYICCQSLRLPGEEFSRGYLLHWLGKQKIEERSVQKIFKAADAILRAGRPGLPDTGE